MKLLGVSASLTKGGRTRSVLEFALRAAGEGHPGITTELIDLRDFRISLCDGRPLAEYPDDTQRVVERLGAGDAYVFATPVYRGSYSGALKNLIDHTPVEALLHKPIGLIAVGATDHHYLVIDHELRSLLAWFNALVLPGSVYVQSAHFDGEALVDERTRDHLRQLGESMVALEAQSRGLSIGPPPLAMWSRR